MDSMSPQQQEHKRHLTSQSLRRQSAPSLVITRALTRSKTLSRESFLVPPCPETCPLVQSVLGDSADRSFLLHGHVQLKTGMQTQDRHLFLFNDILVVAKAKSANHFKLKARVCVCEMWTAGCMDEVCEGTTNPERSFVMGWPTCNCAATFSSTEQKERWLSLLKSLIKEEKEKEEPKTIPLRVYGKGINSFAVIKTLPVSNSDSTNEVIRLALQQFGVIGHVKDYQLWVISKRDNAPYPLIGHEFPFSVHMSHVRHAVSQGGGGAGGREAAAPSVDRQALLQTEQLRVNKQCQFILRPRPMETQMQQVAPDSSQKPFKRRRSLITWAFWRGSASHLNELSLVEAPRGCLFGRPLSSVCVEDSLPRPVMDMLAFLYHEGSWTRGIFRRPAGARAIRELRDSLDAGEFQLPLTRDHVFVIAGVFKDFLRSIPGSLLCCELHEDWMDVLEDEEEEEEEQVQDIHRMIGRLPKENTLLLRFLLAVLHGIQGNAAENQMTTFNLSVCIAPSMLWPPGAPCSPEVEGEGTKKVCELVKFMIEHCQEILEEDPCSLFGGPPRRSHTDDMGPGPLDWTYPLTDSSYDSLENELDDSSGGSPAFCSRGRLRSKPLQGSLDSVLTFSDNDHDADPDTHRSQAERDPGQDAPVDTSSTLVSRHRQRRSSEPAIAYLTKFGACTSGSSDGLTGEDEDGEEEKSSQDSLRSLSSDHTCVTRRAANSSKTCPTSNGTAEMSPPCSLSSAPTSSGSADQRINSSIGQPKDLLSWGTLKGCRGLHPNCWLKKDQRLTLTQQDNWDKEQDKTWGASERSERAGGKQQRAKTSCTVTEDAGGGGGHVRGRSDPFSSTSHHHSARSPWLRPSDSMLMASAAGDISIQRQAAEPVVKELKQPSPSSLHRHPGPSLSLFKRHKSHSVEEEHHATLHQRRASEPGCRVMDRASVAARARLPSDPGLKVSEVDSEGAASEARFCLSPRAAKAVRDYFSSHPDSNPKSSQQVALALVESHREWLKRCSDPTAEPDYDQLLFAEESYV